MGGRGGYIVGWVGGFVQVGFVWRRQTMGLGLVRGAMLLLSSLLNNSVVFTSNHVLCIIYVLSQHSQGLLASSKPSHRVTKAERISMEKACTFSTQATNLSQTPLQSTHQPKPKHSSPPPPTSPPPPHHPPPPRHRPPPPPLQQRRADRDRRRGAAHRRSRKGRESQRTGEIHVRGIRVLRGRAGGWGCGCR